MQTHVPNKLSFFNIERKCSDCGHIKVCTIFMGIAPLLTQKWTDDTRPFEPEQIATVCRHFISKSVIDSLREM